MIAKEILKKHNLKAVPFSCIGEGETFYDEGTLTTWPETFVFYERRVQDGDIEYAEGVPSLMDIEDYLGEDVCIYVWRVTNN